MAEDYTQFSIEIDRGDTAFFDFTVLTNGIAQNITGWLIWFTAKRRVGDTDLQAVLQKSTALGGVTITNAGGGVGFVTISPADTAGLAAERQPLFADLQGKDGGGNIFTLQKGKLVIRPDATVSTT